MARTPTRVALALLACLPVALASTASASALPDVGAAVAAAAARLLQVGLSHATPWPRPDRPEDLGPVPRATTAHAAAPGPSTVPVLDLHGAILSPGCVGTDVTAPVAGLTTVLRRHGWTGPVRGVAYYCADSGRGAVDIRGTARPTADTNITDIAQLLAWYVYRSYSSHGVAVDLVGHSMGGLIIRDALAGAGKRGFPPYLRVRDVVTISAPYAGIPSRSICPLQCQQMAYGSAYLAGTSHSASPPQGRGGTMWTEIGGSPCDSIPAASTLALRGSLRVDLGDRTPVCYTHLGYLNDSSSARNLPATVTSPAGRVTRVTGPHSLEWVYQGLMR
ncbi:MAG TPA: hypothetical protein VGH01_05220 [Jatrophihabitantaceae bacterium]